MKIVFIGTVTFSRSVLAKLDAIGANIVGVIGGKNRELNADFAELGPFCIDRKIPYLAVGDVHDPAAQEWINKKSPDIIFCCGWSQILGQEILRIPPRGVVGFHPTALPKNRGRHPIIWALVLGLKQTASTFFFMDQGTDSGDIISQKTVPIGYEDDAGSLYEKITATALKQIECFLPEIERGDMHAIPQDHTKATYWRRRTKRDGLIDFRMSSRGIYNLVRALAPPYPGAHFMIKGRQIKVWKVREVKEETTSLEPGKVLDVTSKGVLVKCGEDAVLLKSYEPIDDFRTGEYFI